MLTYTTLGAGKSAKVLRTPDHGPAHVVTSCPADLAPRVALALQRTDRCFAAALYPVAVHYDGTGVQARRLLLDRFDQICADGTYIARTDHWQLCDGLLVRLADAVAGAPDPVRAAVRAELADHLAGYDGILVPARAATTGYKRKWLDVCVSAALTAVDWEYLFTSGDLVAVDDDPVLPAGGRCVTSTNEFYVLTDALYAAEPAGVAWADGFDMADLVASADHDGGTVEFGIRAEHLRAWVAVNRPGDVARFDALLTTTA